MSVVVDTRHKRGRHKTQDLRGRTLNFQLSTFNFEGGTVKGEDGRWKMESSFDFSRKGELPGVVEEEQSKARLLTSSPTG